MGVPEHRHGDAAGVIGRIACIQLMQEVSVIQVVATGAVSAIKRLAIFQHQPAHHGYADQGFEALERAGYQRAMGPWAGQRNV